MARRFTRQLHKLHHLAYLSILKRETDDSAALLPIHNSTEVRIDVPAVSVEAEVVGPLHSFYCLHQRHCAGFSIASEQMESLTVWRTDIASNHTVYYSRKYRIHTKTFPELTIDCLSTKQILILRARACENLCAFNPLALLQPKFLLELFARSHTGEYNLDILVRTPSRILDHILSETQYAFRLTHVERVDLP